MSFFIGLFIGFCFGVAIISLLPRRDSGDYLPDDWQPEREDESRS